jgi:hypothetical protein
LLVTPLQPICKVFADCFAIMQIVQNRSVTLLQSHRPKLRLNFLWA